MAANQKQVEEKTQDQLKARFEKIVGSLEKEAEERVGKRDTVEKRWLDDLAQYHGRYTDQLMKDLKEAKKSTLYMNSTRPKTNAMASRLQDMLFPTDDRNWGIGPTPVPELTVEAEEAAQAAAKSEVALADDPEDPALQEQARVAASVSEVIQARMNEARKRARAMEEEIDDHLREAHYGAQCRQIIEDACKIGTGILKGPVVGDKSRKAWQQQDIKDDSDAVVGAEFVMNDVKDTRPTYWRVDPWNFFPDFDANCIEDAEGIFERHLMNKKQLRRLARQPGFDQNAIRRLLVQGPQSTTPNYVSDLRSITGAYHDALSDRFHVWEYHGPMSMDDMRDIAALTRNSNVMADLEDLEFDPLVEMEAVVWFCQGELLKFGLHYLDSGESIYSVFCLENDDASIFGFGVPYIMRDPQSAMAASWRMLLDNAGLSSGPQIVVNDQVVEPMNGDWTLEPRKLWRRKAGARSGEQAFESIDIPSNIEELTQMIDICKQSVDEETGLPVIAQGEQGTHVTKTAHGMSLLMNSVNVVFRRIVKNWDDDVTTPTIRRTYDFLMQFSRKEHIKGDFEVDARGTSVLLVREMQSQNLMVFLSNFAGHPILGKYLKQEGLPAMRALSRTMMLPSNEIIKSNEEVAQDEAEAAKQPPVPDPEILKIEAMMNDRENEREHQRDMAMLQRETKMLELAQSSNMTLEDIAAKLQNAREERDSKERIVAAEAAVTERDGASGGGYF